MTPSTAAEELYQEISPSLLLLRHLGGQNEGPRQAVLILEGFHPPIRLFVEETREATHQQVSSTHPVPALI